MDTPQSSNSAKTGLLIGMGLAAIAALLLHYSVPLSLGWGMGGGALAGLASDRNRRRGQRLFYGVLAAVIGCAAIFVFSTRAST